MVNRFFSGKSKILYLLLAFIALLLLVGILTRSKLEGLLRRYVENQVAQQARIEAEVLLEMLEAELKNLENISGYIEYESAKQTNFPTIFMEMAQAEDTESVWGVLELGGAAVWGSELALEDFYGIRESFRGNKAVSYKSEKGMLFSVPVYHNGNVKYVLYKLMADEHLADKFGMTYRDGKGRILIATKEEQIVVPFNDWKESDAEFLKSEKMQVVFEQISERMNISSSAAGLYTENNDRQYIFVAETNDYGLVLVGTVDESIASEGMSNIVTLVFWVFGLLLVLLGIGLAFLFGAEEKAKESDELRHAKMMADAANQAKSDFLANMSHEIRTPINAVVGMNEMIIRECEDEDIREYAFNIQSASNNLLALISDILDMSKIESGKMELTNNKYRLSNVLKDVYNMISIKAKQKELCFKMEIDEYLPDYLYGDEVRIRQIILNLLNNAVKYTKKGSVTLKVEKENKPDMEFILKVSVMDTGIGIREEDKNKLFNNFERFDQKRNRNIEGTGLGLAITSKFIELMHGRIEVESVYGEGSTFVVYLPQSVMSDECIGDFEEKCAKANNKEWKYKEKFKAPTAKILVVDDVDMNLFVVKNLLKKTEVQVSCCVSGEECLQEVVKERYDVILLDHMMPVMDGIETLKNMQQLEESKNKETPVIALTANAVLGADEMYLKEGFDDYISKPIDVNKLEEILRKYIPREKIVYEKQKKTMPADEGNEKRKEIASNLLDTSIGMKYSGNSEEIYMEFLKMFADSIEERKQKIEACYTLENWENYTILVHALKSTSLSIGGQQLSELAKKIEMAGKEKKVDVIRQHHVELMRLYDDTVSVCRKYMENGL